MSIYKVFFIYLFTYFLEVLQTAVQCYPGNCCGGVRWLVWLFQWFASMWLAGCCDISGAFYGVAGWLLGCW